MMLLASVACNKETQTDNQPSVELKPQVTLSFNAALTTPTKTEIGNSETAGGVTVHEIYWSKDDKIAVYPHNINSDDPNTKVAGATFTSEDLTGGSAAEATFTGTVTEADAYYAFYPTSVGATWSEQHNNFSVKLSASQKPNGIASGFAVAEVTGVENVTFNHVCGFVKFTIDKDYAGQIKEVRFSGNNNENLAGNINVTSDGSCNTWGTPDKELILTPAEGETLSEGTYYFTCLPVTLTGGLELTFVNTDDEEAVKSSDVAATIERADVLNLGTVANLEFKSVTPPLADGNYVILAKQGDVYYAMGCTHNVNPSRLDEVEFNINATEIYDNSYVWSFKNISGANYEVTNHEGKYLSASSSNNANVKAVETSMVVSDNEDGTYLITTVYNEVTRYLSRNDYNKGFAFYGNTDQNENLYLKAITYVELPKLVAPEIVVTGDDASKSITVTWTDVENATSYEVVCGEKTQTVNQGVQTCTFTMDAYDTYDVTVTAKADGYVSATSAESSITLKDPTDTSISLTFPDENNANNKQSGYTATWTAKSGNYEWSIANFNNNQWNWSSIKCGRKSEASVASITTTTPLDKSITKVIVVYGSVTPSSLNSAKLQVSSTADFSEILQETDIEVSQGEQTYEISSPSQNRYYRLTYDCQIKSNGFIEIVAIRYLTD